MKEIWKDVRGYKGMYQVSSKGRVRTLGRYIKIRDTSMKRFLQPKFLRFIYNRDYHTVCLYKNYKAKWYKVHQLVAKAFIPNPYNKPQINHKNCKRKDNRVKNLEWATQKENNIHMHKMGRVPSGCKSKLALLNSKQLIQVRAMIKSGYTQQTIADKFKVSRTTISNITRNVTYKRNLTFKAL